MSKLKLPQSGGIRRRLARLWRDKSHTPSKDLFEIGSPARLQAALLISHP